MMDNACIWRWIMLVVTDCFAIFNAFTLLNWRVSKRTMYGIAAGFGLAICLLSILGSYQCKNPGLVWPPVAILLIGAAWLLSEQRDARTLFGLLNVWTLSITAYLVIKASTLYVPDLWARIAVALAINLLFSYCIYFHLRPPYLQMISLEKRGWWIACCVPALPSVSIFLMARQLRIDPDTFSTCILVSASTLVCYLVVAKLIGRIHEQQTREQTFHILSEQVHYTERQMKDIEQRDRQNAILRHDLRHFASVIASCLQKNLYDEALQSVQSLLKHPAMVEPEQRYCKNPTLNALLSTCIQRAQNAGILFHAGVSLEENICVDVMDLAVLLSNTLENAINACMRQPEGAPREIRLKLYMVGKQIYISISNTCQNPVPINEQTGLPMPGKARGGHGIGLVSVQTFLKTYNAHTDCVQKDGWFQLRIVASARPPKKQPNVRSANKNKQISILRVNLIISAVVVTGFCMAGISSYISFNNLFKTGIESVSTLSSENIHVTVNNLMERPINVSLAMAHDTLLQELMRREAREGVTPRITETIRQYLQSYQNKYHFASVTLTSAQTNTHYHFEKGIARVLSPNNPEDQWYFRFLQDESECKLSIDHDKIDAYQVTIFSDTKLQDDTGKILGTVGIGMRTPYIQQVLADNEQRYNLHAYLIDERGTIQISSGKTMAAGINLFDDPKFTPMQEAILANHTTAEQRWYSDGEVDGYIIARYIPNLNWYLVVEKDTAQLRYTMIVQLLAGLLFMVLVVVIVLFISTSIIAKYSQALVGLTQRDPLTGLRNRACYEQEQYIYSGRLTDYEEFGIGMFDLNNLKRTNEVFGHQAGDAYLRDFAKLLCEAFPCCPVFRIGGDEFVTFFLNISEEEVLQKWEVLRLALARRSKDNLVPNSTAFGYAFRDNEQYHTIEAILKEADRRMYENKQTQKACV